MSTTATSQIDDDTFEYAAPAGSVPMLQCISGFGNNAIDDITEKLYDVAAQERDSEDAIKAIGWHISELVRWCRHHNGARQRAEAELAAVRQERDKLRDAARMAVEWADGMSSSPLEDLVDAWDALRAALQPQEELGNAKPN